MNEQIIVTKNNYGIELSVQFVDSKKKPINITGQTIEVIIIKSDGTKTSHNAYATNLLEGRCAFVLTENETSLEGLCSAYFSAIDEDNNITAQEALYYYITEEHGGNTNPITPTRALDDTTVDPWSRTQIIDTMGSYKNLSDKINSLDINGTNQEVILARGNNVDLPTRLNKNEEQLATVVNNLNVRPIDGGVF